MSFLFGGAKIPKAPAMPTPPPTETEALKEEEKKRLRGTRTKRGTLLTGPRGLLEPAPVIHKSLLGE